MQTCRSALLSTRLALMHHCRDEPANPNSDLEVSEGGLASPHFAVGRLLSFCQAHRHISILYTPGRSRVFPTLRVSWLSLKTVQAGSTAGRGPWLFIPGGKRSPTPSLRCALELLPPPYIRRQNLSEKPPGPCKPSLWPPTEGGFHGKQARPSMRPPRPLLRGVWLQAFAPKLKLAMSP